MVKYCIGLLLICIVQPIFAAVVAVKLDRNVVEMDESFTVVFSSSASVDDDPDFTPLQQNFQILNRNQSSNIQIINGKMSRQSSWTLSLMAKKTGKLKIPAIKFGSDSSQAVNVIVKKSAQATSAKNGAPIFMEVEFEPKQVYVQAQVIYTIRVYHAVNLMDASLTELKLDDSDTIVETLGDNASFDKRINGKQYKVFEKKYALFPQKSGSITVAPFVFETRYVGNRRNLKHRKLRSKAVNIAVLPKPKTKTGKPMSYWLPASSIKVTESWGDKKPKFIVGEPVTRTLRITAQGLPASLLPNLHTESLKFAKLYPDQPKLTDSSSAIGVVGVREDKVAIIPTKSGKFSLPEIKVPWWNTTKNRWDHVIVKAKTISVAPAIGTSIIQPQTPLSNDVFENSAPQTIETQDETSQPQTFFGFGQKFWFALSILFLYLWLLTIVAWWYYARRAKKKSILKKDKNTGSKPGLSGQRLKIEKRLNEAGKRGEPDEIKRLLIEWGLAVFPENPPHSLGALAKQCGGPLEDEINDINKVIYSNKDAAWNVDGILTLIKNYQQQNKGGKQQDELAPMYFHVTE